MCCVHAGAPHALPAWLLRPQPPKRVRNPLQPTGSPSTQSPLSTPASQLSAQEPLEHPDSSTASAAQGRPAKRLGTTASRVVLPGPAQDASTASAAEHLGTTCTAAAPHSSQSPESHAQPRRSWLQRSLAPLKRRWMKPQPERKTADTLVVAGQSADHKAVLHETHRAQRQRRRDRDIAWESTAAAAKRRRVAGAHETTGLTARSRRILFPSVPKVRYSRCRSGIPVHELHALPFGGNCNAREGRSWSCCKLCKCAAALHYNL